MFKYTQKISILLLLILSMSALAAIEIINFQNQEEQERFKKLASTLRCPKCQNQSLADSNAPIAADMRNFIHKNMNSGATDEYIVQQLVQRYGDFVKYEPPFNTKTILLWLLPVCFLTLGLIIFIIINKQNKTIVLTDTEKLKLQQLLN